jgi:hypothetical protein
MPPRRREGQHDGRQELEEERERREQHRLRLEP